MIGQKKSKIKKNLRILHISTFHSQKQLISTKGEKKNEICKNPPTLEKILLTQQKKNKMCSENIKTTQGIQR